LCDGVHFLTTLEVAMAKAKRERRNSIRTMSADASALEALESLERAERSAGEAAPEPPEAEPATASAAEGDKD
jgi:hypothetical protein